MWSRWAPGDIGELTQSESGGIWDDDEEDDVPDTTRVFTASETLTNQDYDYAELAGDATEIPTPDMTASTTHNIHRSPCFQNGAKNLDFKSFCEGPKH